MKIPSGIETCAVYGGIVQPQQKRLYTSAPATAQTSAASAAKRFDQISISEQDSNTSKFAMMMKSQITREVRESVTTGMLSSLQAEVSSGEYQLDPESIARRMLLLGEE